VLQLIQLWKFYNICTE